MVRPTNKRLLRGGNKQKAAPSEGPPDFANHRGPFTWEDKLFLLQNCQKYSAHFNGLETAELAALADECHVESFENGRPILRHHEEELQIHSLGGDRASLYRSPFPHPTPDAAVLILRGSAEVFYPGSGRAAGTLFVGDFAGELSVFQTGSGNGGAEQTGRRLADVVSATANTLVMKFIFTIKGMRFRLRQPALWLTLLRMFARAGIARLGLAYNMRPQATFDERPLLLPVFMGYLANAKVRSAFGFHWEPGELEVLGRHMYFMTLSRGSQLYKKGAWYEHMCIVLEGTFESFVDGPHRASFALTGRRDKYVVACSSASLGIKRRGDWIGAATLAYGIGNPTLALHPCDVYAAEYCELLHINRRALTSLYLTHPHVALKLYMMIGGVVLTQFLSSSPIPGEAVEVPGEESDSDGVSEASLEGSPAPTSVNDFLGEEEVPMPKSRAVHFEPSPHKSTPPRPNPAPSRPRSPEHLAPASPSSPDRELSEGLFAGIVIDTAGSPDTKARSSERTAKEPPKTDDAREAARARERQQRARAIFIGGVKRVGDCHPQTDKDLPRNMGQSPSDLVEGTDARWVKYTTEQLTTMLDNVQSVSGALRGFSHQEMSSLAAAAHVFSVEERGTILREDAPASYLGIVLSGKADVHMQGQDTLFELRMGDLVGTAALFHTGAWMATATCVTSTCQVAVFEFWRVVNLCREDRILGPKLMRMLAYAAVRAQRDCAMVVAKPCHTRGIQLSHGSEYLPQAFCASGLLHEAGMGGENQVTMLAEHARVATLRPGCLVFAPGPCTQLRGLYAADTHATGPYLVFVLDGAVAAMAQGEELGTWHAGDCIGGEAFLLESAMHDGSPSIYPEALVASGERGTTVAYLTYDDLENLNLDFPKFAQMLFIAVVRHYLARLAVAQLQKKSLDDQAPIATWRRLLSGAPRWQAEVAGLQFTPSNNPQKSQLFIRKEDYEDAEYGDAPLSSMMRMKGRGASLLVAEEVGKMMGATLTACTRTQVREIVRDCRRTCTLWNGMEPAEIDALPDVVELLELTPSPSDRNADGNERWRPMIHHTQSVSFWLFLLKGDLRWRLPANEQSAQKLVPVPGGEILGDVSLLCGVPHIGVLESRGPVLLAAMGADAFLKMEALHHSSTQGLAVKLVTMLMNAAIDKVGVTLPSALVHEEGPAESPLMTGDSTESEHLKLTYLAATHKATGCFGRMEVEDIPMMFLYCECVTLPAGKRIFARNEVGKAVVLILEGVAQIYEDYGAERRKGDYLGEEAFFQSGDALRVNKHTVTASTRMVVCVLSFEQLDRMMVVRPDLAIEIILRVGALMVQRSLDKCPPAFQEPAAEPTDGPAGTAARERRILESAVNMTQERAAKLMDNTQACSIFWTGFTQAQLRVLAQHVIVLHLKKGETIVLERGRSGFMGVIAFGEAQTTINGEVTGTLRRGDVVGEVGVFKEGFNFIGVTSTDHRTLVLSFLRGSLKHFFVKYPQLGLKMMRMFYTAAVTKMGELELDVAPQHSSSMRPLPTPLVAVTQLLYSAHHASMQDPNLRHVSFGRSVPYRVMDKLAYYLSVATVPPRKDLWQADRAAPPMMLMVLEGDVRLHEAGLDSPVLAEHPKGTLVGTAMFLDSQRVRKCLWRTSAYAGDFGAKVAVITHEVLAKMLERFPVDCARLYARLGEMVVSEKLEHLNTRLAKQMVEQEEQQQLEALQIPQLEGEAFEAVLRQTQRHHQLSHCASSATTPLTLEFHGAPVNVPGDVPAQARAGTMTLVRDRWLLDTTSPDAVPATTDCAFYNRPTSAVTRAEAVDRPMIRPRPATANPHLSSAPKPVAPVLHTPEPTADEDTTTDPQFAAQQTRMERFLRQMAAPAPAPRATTPPRTAALQRLQPPSYRRAWAETRRPGVHDLPAAAVMSGSRQPIATRPRPHPLGEEYRWRARTTSLVPRGASPIKGGVFPDWRGDEPEPAPAPMPAAGSNTSTSSSAPYSRVLPAHSVSPIAAQQPARRPTTAPVRRRPQVDVARELTYETSRESAASSSNRSVSSSASQLCPEIFHGSLSGRKLTPTPSTNRAISPGLSAVSTTTSATAAAPPPLPTGFVRLQSTQRCQGTRPGSAIHASTRALKSAHDYERRRAVFAQQRAPHKVEWGEASAPPFDENKFLLNAFGFDADDEHPPE